VNQPKNSASRRFARRLGWTRNPVCRPVDRIEGTLRLALGLLLATVLAASTWIGFANFAKTSHAADTARAHLHRVSVVLLEDVPTGMSDASSSLGRPGVQARWTLPDGSARVGAVFTREVAHSGDNIVVWMNAFDDPVPPPIDRGDLVVRAALRALATLTLAGLALWLFYGLTRRHLNRRRDAAWTREWLLVSGGWRDRSL